MDDNRKKLYDALSKEYDMGTFEQFCKDIQDEGKRRKLYDATSDEYDYGSYDSFSKQLMGASQSQQPAAQAAPVPQQPTTAPAQAATPAPSAAPAPQQKWQPTEQDKIRMSYELGQMMNETQQGIKETNAKIERMVEPLTQKGRERRRLGEFQARMAGTPTHVMGFNTAPKAPAPKDDKDSLSTEQPVQSEQSPQAYGVVYDENGKAKTQWVLPDGSLTSSLTEANQAEYNARNARLAHQFQNRMKEAGLDPNKPQDVQKEHLLHEKKRIEQEMNKRGRELDAKVGDFSWRDMPRGSGGAIHTYNSSTTNGRYADSKYKSLVAQLNKVNEGLDILEEAKKGMASDQWIDDSSNWASKKGKQLLAFGAGAWRGLAHAVGKVSTWDMGMTDMVTNGALYSAAVDADGKGIDNLTQEDRDLLNITAYTNAIQSENGQYLGRGYKAGTVTGESLPFMIEMMLNPASKLGTTATNKLAREAVRRFGKEAVKKATKKYLAAKIGTRLVGDAVGSAVMAGTTGQGHVTADMLNRMTGDIKFKQDENGQIVYDGREGAEDSALKAYLKAFGAQTIENHSEMVGEYFAPFLGKAASLSRKGMEKIGLGKVNKLIDDIGATNIAKMIGDFEKQTKWNGTFGEYAEEVVGSIENALLVGDNTLDAAENTGVFNLDQNIDTFLGVGLMGGFFAGAKTLSYRGPKRQALNEMSDAGKAIENAIGGNVPMMEKWGSWRNTFLVGTDEEKKAALREVMDNADLPMNFRMGVLNFVKAAQKYEGLSRAQENKVQNGEQDPVAQAYDESYDNGYDTTEPEAMNDAKNLLDMKREQVAKEHGIENVDEVDALIGDDPLRYIDEQRKLGNTDKLQSVIDYANAKSAYDGMVQRVRDDIDSRIEESDATVNGRVNRHDGMIHPASLKLQNEDGTDKKAYIVSGNVVMFEDGKGVDKEKSDQTIVIRDVETGEMKVIPPDLIHGLDAAIDPEEEKARAREAIIEEMSQTAANNVDGVVSFNEGDTYTLTDENGGQTQVILVANEQGLVDNGDGTVNVTIDGQNIVPMSMGDIQSGVDATNMARTMQAELERQANGESVPNLGESVSNSGENVPNSGENVQKTPEGVQYGVNNTFTLLDGEGTAIHGEVQGISDDGVEIRTDEPLNGKYVQIVSAEDFESMVESINDADGNPVWAREYADDAGTTEDTSGSPTPPTTEELVQMARGGNELAQYQLEAQGVQWEDTTSALSRVPVNEETQEPMFEKADKETALDALNEVTGGNEANTIAIVTAQVEQAQKALDALKKKQPTKKAPSLKGSAMEMVKAQQEADANYNAAMEQYNGQVTEAEETLNAWTRIYALMNERKRAVREQQEAEQRERDAKLHDAAVAQVAEQKRIAAEKAAEQAEVGTHAVNPKIKDKWDKSTKVEGNSNALTLADGSTLRGHYVLTEAGAASASHDINNAFEPTEGFPIDENGESVNDRDYKRDTDAQRIVRDIARNYDSRALQSPVIVSKDGIVLSGNNRTMSGDMAAQQGTDKAYIDHLREFGQMYGFTPEQIDGMKHPRVVFVPDEELPYDAATFARFNAESQKKQSKPEQAVKLGKVVPDNVFNSIVGDISRYDRLSDYYADDKAVSSAISQLQRAGVINEMQLPEMRTGNALSAAGKELIENTLIGKVFQTSPDAVRQIISTPTLRQSVIMGLNEIAHNRTLAKSGYDLSQELGAAVDLVARAKSVHPDIFKDGMPVSPFGRQQGLFDDEYGDSRVTDAIVLLLSDVLNSGKPSDLRKFLSVYNNEAVSPAGGQLDVFSGEVTSKEELLNRITEYFRNATPREQQAIVDAAIAERKQRAETTEQDADGTGRDGENPSEATTENGSVGLRNDGRGRVERHSDQRQSDLAKTGNVADNGVSEWYQNLRLSGELDQNNSPFILSPNGQIDFGQITEAHHLPAAPIRLSMGDMTNGYIHINRRHGKQIQKAGFDSIEAFVDYVVNNFTRIREGASYENASGGKNNTYLIQLQDGHNNTLFVQLSRDGKYWNVNSAGVFGKKYGDKKEEIWSASEVQNDNSAVASDGLQSEPITENGSTSNGTPSKNEEYSRHATAKQPVETAETSQGVEQSDTQEPSRMNVPTSSVDKVINNQSDLQENGEKSLANNGVTSPSEQIETASAEVNTNPTEAQKEAGNYKKGHVQVGTFDITIEQPQGSVRRGTDANGKKWESRMHNTYGYFRGTEGVDGDHIDVFLSGDIDSWNGRKVYVVDQYNPDGTFDEHKVMLGFNDMDEAKSDYLANYEKGWEDGRRIDVSATNIEDFERWIDSSHRKIKPFAEYAGVKKETNMAAPAKTETEQTERKGYSIAPSTYTNKKGKTSDVSLLTFNHDLTADQERAVKEFAKERTGEGRFAPARGWKDRESGGWMFRNEEDARKAAEMVGSEDAVADNQPLTISNLRETEETATQESIQEEDIFEKAERIAKEEQAKRKAEENTRMVHEAVGKTYTRESVTEDGKPYTETMTILSADGKMVETDMNTVAYGGHYSMPIEKAAEELNENGWVEQTTSVDGATATLGHKPTSEKPKKNPSGNKLVTDERYEELKKRMKAKLRGQMNMGIDPEILAIGTEMAVYHIEKGARKFAEYAKGMIDDLGDEIRPYLKAFYNGARDLPEVEEMGLAKDMTSYDDVRTFDVANFDKQSVSALATAEQVVAEQKTAKQAEEAKKKLTAQRNEKRKERNLRAATEEDLEQNPVIYYKGEPHRILMVKHEGEQVGALAFSKPKITGVYLENGKEVQLTDLQVEDNISHDDGNSDIHRTFAMVVKNDMLSSLDNGTKPYRSILDLRKRASELGMDVDNDGRTDILLQELVEDGLVRAAREVVQRNGRDSKETYDLICRLYEMQPAISARSSNRIKMQQYSTPLPMAWNAGRFAMSGKENGKVLEPTAGNGMLVFAVPARQVHANELDETRLANLREQGFAEVTRQDATEPFEGGQQYDVVIANPPFGKREAVEYDGKMIGGLDPQITLNALASMKDDGRAAIIIGGNMEYAKNGGLNSMKPFFTYLYDHYNVKGVVDMDGKLYAKQGTTFPTRMILIDGRRSEEDRAQTAVYPPVESKAVRKAETFEDLYKIVEELTNSTEKTNGTEILRSQQGQLIPDSGKGTGRSNGKPNSEQHPAHDGDGRRHGGHDVESAPQGGEGVLRGEHRTDTGNGTPARGTGGDKRGGSRGTGEPVVRGVDGMGVPTDGVGLTTVHEEPKKRTLTEEKLAYRPHNTAFSLESVAPAAMVEAMDKVLAQIEKKEGGIDEFVTRELGYDTIEDAHNALAAEQMDSVAMAIYQMKQGQAMIIGDQTGVGKGRQMAALIRWAVKRGEKPVFITQKADLFSDIYRDLVDVGSGDLVPFIFNSPTGENKGEMVDANGKVVHKGLSDAKMKKVLNTGKLPDDCDYAVLTYSQVNTGDAISQEEAKAAARKNGSRTKKSKSDGKATPKATFLRAIAKDNYLFLDESHTAAGTSNTGAYLQSILRDAKAATFASATFAKRPDTMPLYAIRTAMSQAKVEPDKMIGIIEKGGVTLQEIMSRELTNAGQMVRRERDMSDVRTDWKTIDDAETVKRARDNYDRTITAFNAIIKFQEDYVKPLIDNLDQELAVMAESAGIKRGTDKLGVDNVPFVSKTYNYTKQLMLALKVDAIVDEVDAEIKAGRHPVIALESTMESSIKDYAAGEVIDEPTFSASLLRGLDSVMQYTVKDENGKENHAYYTPEQLGEAGEKAYHDLQQLIRESTSDIFISPLDAIIDRLHEKGYKVGELTGRNMYVERDENGKVVVRRRTDKDKKRMQREFNNGELDVLILNKSASTGISLHASEKFSDQRQRTMIIAQPLSDINDYMQMIGRIDRTGQVHRGYYINLGLPVPAENRFLMMLSTKLKSLNANTTTSQDSESNEVEAPDLLNKYGSQVVVEYLRDNPDVYDKMGAPLKKGGENGKTPVEAGELDEYKPQEDDARRITGSVALLSTKEQEDFYDDVVRRYNELMNYLNDTGNNDLKITVMPLRAKTIDKRVSSEGIDPNGSNPFAKNSYVEKVEMDVLRKPMKADEVRKTIEQVCRGQQPEDCLRGIIATIKSEDEARMAAEENRYEKALQRAQEDIAKQTEKINSQQKRTAEEKQSAIAAYTSETNERVEVKHSENKKRIKLNQQLLVSKLNMFEVGKSYLVPDNLETQMFDFAAPGIFCGYKAKDSKITASTTLAVFATLDGRRRVEVKLSQLEALNSIQKMTNDNWDSARSTTIDNWDSQIPTESRKIGYIMTGNILQAIADTQDEKGGYPGQLISYTDIDGNVHDGILMPDKWNATMLKTSGAPLISRLQQIKNYQPIVSHDGKVEITGSAWAKTYYLTVPKTKKDGAVYYENKTLLRAAGGNFYPYHGKLRADISAHDIEEVVKELSKLGVKVREEIQPDEDKTKFRLLEDDAPKAMEQEAMTARVNELAERLHTPVHIIRTDEEVVALPSARQRRMKGSFNPLTGEVTIVVPNNANMADVENTFIHEVVGHDGLRVLFPEEEKLNNALDELYRVSSTGIQQTIDRMARKMYDAEVDRLREKKRKAHEAKGEDSNASYYADMAEAHAEASKKREQFKRDATEEYGADLAGRIGENGFEKMSAEELTFWGKLKAMLQKALQKLLSGLKIPGKKKWSDKEWAFVLHEAYKRKKNGGNPTVFDAADTEVMRRKTGFDKVMYSDGAIREELDRVNERFNNQLAKFTVDNADKINFNLGNPSAKLLSAGVADKPIRLHGSKVVKKMKKHGFSIEELRDLPKAVANPIAVFDNLGKDGNRSVLTELKTANGNFLVTIDLGKGTEADFDIVSSVFGKKGHSVATWINKGYMRYVDKKKALNYLHLSAPIAEASDNAELSSAAKVVENFENPTTYDEKVEDEGIMFRDGDSVEYNKAMARDIYEQRVSRGMYQTQEALQDSMLGLKEAMDAILKAEGRGKTYIEDVAGYENAYLGENRLSSVNQAECSAFAQTLFKPMLEEVAKLAKTADERASLTDYMMAKHGLERNEVMTRRAAEKQAGEEFRDELRKAERAVAKDPLDQDAADALDDVKQRKHDREEELYFENRSRDYAGLTALTGMDDVADAEAEAQQMVTDYEAQHDTDDLWDKVNAVTKATLTKTYESGLINKATYDDISGMYENYIPLRGFDEKTSDEAYAYLTDKHSAFNAPIKTAKGRKSKADDPFANMEAMAESAIMQGNRNTLVKQKFLNFALNHPSDLVSVSDLWLWHNDAADEWQPINSGDLQGTEKIEEGDSPAEVERKMRDFEEAMQQATKSDPAHFKKQKDNPAIPYRVVESRDLRQHQVLVKRNGRDIILTINGNPRLAQALNGQTNPDNDLSGALGSPLVNGIGKLNRFLSSVYTTKNPDFIVSNFMRDMMYANTMVWVKESPNYAWRFHKNFVKVNPAKMKVLLAKLRNGTLDMNDKTEYAFHQFMMNGGETGYSNIRDVEQHKNDIMRQLKKNNGQIPIRKAWDLLGERLDEYNRAIENCARFAAFMTSRQLGRTIDRSVYDAKEISVNFNKKGSGAKFKGANGQTKMGDFAAFAFGWGRVLYVFWNAAIQGSTNFGRQFKRHPKKAIAGAASMFLLGALMASIGGDDGDDEGNKDAYYNLPEYVRRSNVVFRLPGMDKSWISIPLPVEYRAMYGMGELMVSAMSGKEHYTAGELAHQMASQISQMLPIDFMEGGGSFKAFLPSAVKPVAEVIGNESWTGMPIYKKNDYNKNDPEWTKAYKSANKYLVGLSKALNEATGGDAYTSGKIDINPAQVEYLLNGIFGGVSSTIDKLTKMGETIIGDREYDPRSFLLLNRLVKNGDERTEFRAVNNEYFRIKEESEKLRKRLNHYENDTADGVFDYAEKIAWLNNSPEYRILETYEEYSGDIDDINDELKEAARDGASGEERKSLEAELNQKKKELVDAVNEIRNGKR